MIPAREAAIVFGNGTPTGDFGNAMANNLVFTAGSLGLNNSGDTITLKDDTATTLQTVTYGSEGGDNQSLTRDPDWSNAAFVKHSTTTAALIYSAGTRIDGSPFTIASGDLLLSEVMYDPSSSDGGFEWVELANVSNRTIDLSSASLGMGGTDYTSKQYQLSGTVPAGKTFVIGGADSGATNGNPTYDLVLEISIQNSGSVADGVALFNLRSAAVTASTVPIDAVIYGTANDNNLIDETGSVGGIDVADVSGGFSIERVNESGTWQAQGTPTPGSSLMGVTLGSASEVMITEVFYDYSGSDNGNEWVEIYNSSSSAVNLAGMSLGMGGSDYTTSTAQLSGLMPAGAIWVIGGPNSDVGNGNPVYDIVLNFSPDIQNSGSPGDGVALFDVAASAITATTVPIDAVVFGSNNNSGLIDETNVANSPEVGDAAAGSSIERTNLTGSWQIQSTPAPGSIIF